MIMLAAIPLSVIVMGIIFVIVCFLMTLLILIQKPKGGGLTGAFGGGGGSAQSAFGSKTGDVLTYATIGFFLAFMFLAMGMQWGIKAVDTTDPGLSTAPIAPQTPGNSQDAAVATRPATQPTTSLPSDTSSSNSPQPSGMGSGSAADSPGDGGEDSPEDNGVFDTE